MKKYTLALIVATSISTALNAMECLDITHEGDSVFILKVSVQNGPWGCYVCPEEQSLNEGLNLSETSLEIRAKLIELLTTTLTSNVPGEWHEPFCAKAALKLDDANLKEIALRVVKVGLGLHGGENNPRAQEYMNLAGDLIHQNHALTAFFNS